MFLVHGNVRDLVCWDHGDTATYVSVRTFLERFLQRSKEIVVYYNCSEGFKFVDRAHRTRFLRVVNARRVLDGLPEIDELPRPPAEALPLVEALATDPAQRVGIVLDYVETIVPNGDLAFMGEADKSNLVALQRFASDPGLLASDNLLILLSENLADLHRRVVSNPQLASVHLPLPDEGERLAFLRAMPRRGVTLEMTEEVLAAVTAGLSLIQIRGLLRQAQQSGEPVTFQAVSRRKKAIIEQECHGLVEFVEPGHDFSHVGGCERIKEDLMQMASAIRKGQRNRVPMGVIFVGPMGTGKTYVAEAFARESGLTCLKFKNFREKWVGSTEGNLERILHVVHALGYVLLIIDEADRSLSASSESDGGTSGRVVARLKEFMSDTSHRGRVVTLMMTNRPDKLDTDLKRPGRFDVKIPFFFPDNAEERRSILEALLRRNRTDLEPGTSLDRLAAATAGYSSAELEALLLAAGRLSSGREREALSQDDLDAALADVIPSRDTRMLEYMEMLAVFEASARRMLPERHAVLSTEEVQSRLDALRARLGPRAR
ncbi:MAG: ATP-binding protein [Deltaproteobacteria bacterium]|nr:ATP-binding protein [Deltaproteobacteria bacterium]